MFQPDYVASVSLKERLRAHLGRRAVAVAVTLLLEALILLAIWSLSQSKEEPKTVGELVSTFDTEDEPEQQEEEKTVEEPKPTPQKPTEVQPQPVPPVVQPVTPEPVPTTPPTIPISPRQTQAPPPSPPAKPPAKPAAPYGPPNIGGSSSMDSKRVGTAPDGQPIYAVAWYRKPYDSELSGYLSTSQGPGWGEIMCKTTLEFRVENCSVYDESPDRSGIAKAVLAASWQFKVRPARVGGRSLPGTWVLIHIDYTITRK